MQLRRGAPNLIRARPRRIDPCVPARLRRELHLICDNLWEVHTHTSRLTPIAIGLEQLWEDFRGRSSVQRR